MTEDNDANADLKAKMREALERKGEAHHPTDAEGTASAREKVHGSEIDAGGPKMHRRKAGGGGS
ncbi:MAG: DUF5302 domain-containing protein [Nocardioides sp.]|nr:DUF5302 domain-containing protein [Nocardioides sp.]